MVEMRSWLILLIIIIHSEMCFSFKSKAKSRIDILKNKINKALKGSEGKELFFDVNDFEYPGANSTLRKIHRGQWKEYYQCLKNLYSEIGSENSLLPTALMALEGTSVILKCQICISPLEMHAIEAVKWYFKSSNNPNSVTQEVYYTEHLLISPDGNLYVYYVQLDQAGQYWCLLGDTIASPYYLHVDNGSEPILIVHPNEKLNPAIHSQPPMIIQEYGLKVYSSWTDWSECSTCDIVGKKIRYGYCTISLLENSEFGHMFEETYSAQENTERNFFLRKVDKGEEKKEKYNSVLKKLINSVLPVFRNKMPCRSKNMPLEIQNITGVKTRKSEIMYQYCKINCPKNEIFQVYDKYGNVVENANNSAGIYSFIQGLPDLSPTVTRVTFYRQPNKKYELKCPGNINSDAPLIWKVGNKVLTPSSIIKQSLGRIHLSPRQSIIFEKLRYGDKNIYSCWQRNQLAGTIRLEISHEVEIKFDHHIVMFGGIAVVAVFFKVFWKAFQGRKRYTMH